MRPGPHEGTPFERTWYRWRHQVILRGRETPQAYRGRTAALDRAYLTLQTEVYELAEAFRQGRAPDAPIVAGRLRANLLALRAEEAGLPDEVRVGYILFGDATEALLTVIGGADRDAGAV